MLIDSHCHLEYKGLVEDQQGVLARARDAGVGGFLSISTRQREWGQVIATAEREADVWAAVVLAIGGAVGAIRIGSFALGPAAVLFTGHTKVDGRLSIQLRSQGIV